MEDAKVLIVPFVIAFVVIESILLVFALVRKHKRKRRSVAVNAVIDDMVHYPTDAVAGTREHYTPIYKYTYNGKEYAVESQYAIDHRKYKSGDQVQIHINPNKPDEYIGDEDHFKKIYIVFPLVILFGFLWLLFGP